MLTGRQASVLAALAIALYAGVLILSPERSWIVVWFTDIGMALASGTAAATALLTARRLPPGAGRRSWTLIGSGLACWALGDVCWGAIEILTGEAAPTPSLADAFYLAMIPLVFVGILIRPVTATVELKRRLLFLDVGITWCAIAGIAWALFLRTLFETTDDDRLTQAISLAYSLGDVAILFCLVMLAMREHRRSDGTNLLIVGWLLAAFADIMGYLPLDEVKYQTGDPLGAAWFAGLVLVALAAHVDRPAAEPSAPRPLDIGHPWRFFGPSVIVGLAGLLAWGPGLIRAGRLPDLAEVMFALAGLLLLLRYVLGYRDTALAHAYEQLRRQEVQELALRDPLTNAANRRAFEARLAELVEQARSTGRTFGLAFADVDHFKRYNDTFGHAAGDEALRVLVRVLEAESGAGDLVARVGGDELAVLIPDIEPASFEAQVGRLLAILRTHPRVQASVGGAVWSPTMREPRDLMEAADRALYEAKQHRTAPAAVRS